MEDRNIDFGQLYDSSLNVTVIMEDRKIDFGQLYDYSLDVTVIMEDRNIDYGQLYDYSLNNNKMENKIHSARSTLCITWKKVK